MKWHKQGERSAPEQSGPRCSHKDLVPCPACKGWGLVPAGTIEVEVRGDGHVARTYFKPNGRLERCGRCMTLGLVEKTKPKNEAEKKLRKMEETLQAVADSGLLPEDELEKMRLRPSLVGMALRKYRSKTSESQKDSGEPPQEKGQSSKQ